MSVDAAVLSLDNPVLQTYVVAASIMILKTDAPAVCWTWGSLAVIAMALYALAKVV